MIHVQDLSKSYGRRLAVDRLSFTVEAGQICALLGPNGAGKTTTMRMLVGLSAPHRGLASLFGQPVGLGASVLRRVGVLIDGPAFVPHLTGRVNLELLWWATCWTAVRWRTRFWPSRTGTTVLRVELTTQLRRVRTLIALAGLAAVPIVAGLATASEAGHRNGNQGGLFGAAPYSALNHTMA